LNFNMGQYLTTEEFIKRSNVTHNNKYTYPDEYVASKQKIKIICPDHGSFYQTAADHISGHGCKKCKKINGKWSKDEDLFLKINYKTKGAYYCADHLKRSEHSIRGRANVIGLQNKHKSVHQEIPSFIWLSIMYRAKKDGFELDIDPNYIWDLFIQQDGKCALTNWKISFNKNRKLNTVSVDRIDSTKGYIKGNVQLTNKLVNRCKLNCPEDLFYDICKSIYLNKKHIYDTGSIEWEWDIMNDTEQPVRKVRSCIRDDELFFNASNEG